MIRQQEKSNDNLVNSTHAAIKRRYSQAFKYPDAAATAYSLNQSRIDDDLQLIRRKIRRQNEKKDKDQQQMKMMMYTIVPYMIIPKRIMIMMTMKTNMK